MPFSKLTKVGKWIKTSEHMSDAAASFQKKVTGIDANNSFLLDGVKFDGITKDGVLLDAKSGMSNFVKNGQFQSWFKGADGMVDQAYRQINAADGTPIQWHFQDKEVMQATQNLFEERGVKGIDFIHTQF